MSDGKIKHPQIFKRKGNVSYLAIPVQSIWIAYVYQYPETSYA